MEKLTYAMALDVAMESVTDVAVKEKLGALKESLGRKSKGGKSKAKVEADMALMTEVMDFLGTVEKATISQITKGIHDGELSPQKVMALVKALIADGKVVRAVEKRVAYFSVA